MQACIEYPTGAGGESLAGSQQGEASHAGEEWDIAISHGISNRWGICPEGGGMIPTLEGYYA